MFSGTLGVSSHCQTESFVKPNRFVTTLCLMSQCRQPLRTRGTHSLQCFGNFWRRAVSVTVTDFVTNERRTQITLSVFIQPPGTEFGPGQKSVLWTDLKV